MQRILDSGTVPSNPNNSYSSQFQVSVACYGGRFSSPKNASIFHPEEALPLSPRLFVPSFPYRPLDGMTVGLLFREICIKLCVVVEKIITFAVEIMCKGS